MNKHSVLHQSWSITVVGIGLLVCVVLSLFLIFKAVVPGGMYDTHDGTNHLARFSNYRIALREGQIPPRWGPNLLNHYGYPVFLLNYPLLNILSLPISIAGISYEMTFNILSLVLMAFGSVGLIFWLINLNKSQSTSGLIFTTCIYATSPFVWNVLFVRSSIGELAAYSIFPWVLFAFEYQRTKVRRTGTMLLAAFVYAAFLLSHNISALVGSLVLGLWLVTAFKLKKVIVIRWISTICISFGLVAWFWIPALMEASETIVFQAGNNSTAIHHLISLDQLLSAPLSFGYSYEGMVDSMSFMFHPVLIVMFLLSLVLVVYAKIGHKEFDNSEMRPVIVSLLICCTLLLFETTLTRHIWEILPNMSILQFPWRLSLFATILALPTAHWLWLHSSTYLKGVWLLMVILLLMYELSVIPNRVITRPDAYYETFAETTSTQHENMPKSFHYLNIGDWKASPTFLTGTGSFIISQWNGTKRSYTVTTTERVIIVEPTANFIGWNTYATDTKSSSRLLLPYIDSEEISGRIAYELQPGEYVIHTKFGERTFARVTGDVISVITFAGFVFAVFYVLKSRHT